MNPQLSDLIDIGANLTHSAFEHDFEDDYRIGKCGTFSHYSDRNRSSFQYSSNKSGTATSKFFSSTAGFHPHVSENVTKADFDLLPRPC